MSATVRLIESDLYTRWFQSLSDQKVKGAVLARVRRLSAGNAGDTSVVGEGVSELRLHLGAGWRVYYVRRGERVILLFGGGSKRTQKRDIRAALELARSATEMDDG